MKKRLPKTLIVPEESIDWNNLLVVIPPKFIKQLRKKYSAQKNIIAKFKYNLALLLVEPFHSSIYNHPLTGYHAGFWTFSIGGDRRVLYYFRDKQTIVLYKVGDHAELYY